MSKKFILVDKEHNAEKEALCLVKFNYESNDYLVYSVEESEENRQIFASRLILNSEGKYFIDGLDSSDKGKISNIVYNIVILLPTDNQKGEAYDKLVGDFTEKFATSISLDIPDLDKQEYYTSSSIAITSKVLVEVALKFYQDNMKKEDTSIPTWTVPVQSTTPAEITDAHDDSNSIVTPTLSIEPADSTQSVPSDNVPLPVVPTVSDDGNEDNEKKEQRIAVVSDPNLGIAGLNIQPNLGKMRKAGFANSKYVIIGTVCLVLAIVVVVVTYFLIKNVNA